MTQPYIPMSKYHQFIVWNLVHVAGEPKPRKVPCDMSGFASSAHDPANWMDFDTASTLASLLGETYGVGFVFTSNDPFWVIDIDACRMPDSTWSSVAQTLMSLLPGCLVEVSQSGKGLHLIGSGVCPPHAKKNTALQIEMYDTDRFIALGNMQTAIGSAGADFTHVLPHVVAQFFPIQHEEASAEWTTEPCEEWNGIGDDSELIQAMLKSRSASATFGGGITFSDLWFANSDALARVFPATGAGDWDRSSADASMAQMLAFWTGKHCDRIERLMRASALVREKWEREDYLPRTILRACSLQNDVYGQRSTITIDPTLPLAKLKGTAGQIAFAESIRAEAIHNAPDRETQLTLASQTSAQMWINNKEIAPTEIARMVTPAPAIAQDILEPIVKSGFQYLATTEQLLYFKGCVYVVGLNKVFTPKGAFLKSEQFNATYGGYVFQLDETGDKTTKKAWEAFTESQVISYPKADSTWFRPDTLPAALIPHEGNVYVNTFIPVDTRRVKGDPTPFMRHLSLLLPNQRDQIILLSYMAACVQHIGCKFQWTPLIQGTEGNGKTLLTRCVAYAVGEKYTHFPPANEIAEKFNDWLFGKLFIGIEDIYVPDDYQ
jgi:hypothetical protein